MNKLTLIAFSFSLPFLSACTPSMPTLPDLPDVSNMIPDMSLPTLYKDDVLQGSVLDRFKINQLKVGMSQAQVQKLIGSPSIIDPFHNNQWNYINHSSRHEQDDIHYRLALSFSQGKLTKIDTSGIKSLPDLSATEKALEEKRIAEEKAAIEALKQAKINAQKLADEKAQALEEKRIAKEKLAIEKAQAEALKKKLDLEQANQHEIDRQNAIKAAAELKKIQAKKIAQERLNQQKLADEKAVADKAEKAAADKAAKDAETPWYKFW
jgi:outer membrane protein assembly factor BamE